MKVVAWYFLPICFPRSVSTTVLSLAICVLFYRTTCAFATFICCRAMVTDDSCRSCTLVETEFVLVAVLFIVFA